MKQQREHWTREKVESIIATCSSWREFVDDHNRAFRAAYKHQWFDLIDTLQRPEPKWTRESISKLIASCESKSEFRTKYKPAYSVIIKRKWNDLMDCLETQTHWTRKSIKKLAAQCDSLKEFRTKYVNAYAAVIRYNWHDILSSLDKQRDITSESRKTTKNHRPPSKKLIQHLKSCIKQCADMKEFRARFPKERSTIARLDLYYLCDQLPRRRGSEIWTREKCLAAVKKYKFFEDIGESSRSLFSSLHRHGLMDEVSQMLPHRPSKVVTKDQAIKVLSQYDTFVEFRENEPNLLSLIYKHHWGKLLDRLKWPIGTKVSRGGHRAYPLKYAPVDTITKNDVIRAINASSTFKQFHTKFPSEWAAVKRNLWYEMVETLPGFQFNTWNEPLVKSVIKRCKTFEAFYIRYYSAFRWIQRNHKEHLIQHLTKKPNDVIENMKIFVVYCWEFIGHNTFYIGLSRNPRRRLKHEIQDPVTSPVYRFLKHTKCDYKITFLYENLTGREAAQKEIETIQKYRDAGHTLLNQNRGGSLGTYYRIAPASRKNEDILDEYGHLR